MKLSKMKDDIYIIPNIDGTSEVHLERIGVNF